MYRHIPYTHIHAYLGQLLTKYIGPGTIWREKSSAALNQCCNVPVRISELFPCIGLSWWNITAKSQHWFRGQSGEIVDVRGVNPWFNVFFVLFCQKSNIFVNSCPNMSKLHHFHMNITFHWVMTGIWNFHRDNFGQCKIQRCVRLGRVSSDST